MARIGAGTRAVSFSASYGFSAVGSSGGRLGRAGGTPLRLKEANSRRWHERINGRGIGNKVNNLGEEARNVQSRSNG